MGRNRCEVVECFDSDILSILRCVSSLDELVNDVLSCMCCKPSDRRIQQILTCVVLNEVGLLSNATFGLNAINNEIQFIGAETTLINSSVNSPVFGLQAISNDINSLETEVFLINNNVNNPTVGLAAIRNSTRFIENEVILINNVTNSPTVGLAAIKNDVKFIEDEVILIKNSTSSPTVGLAAIKNDVKFIEDEVILIKNSINNSTFGLCEIESKVRLIEEISLHEYPELTSGPIFAKANARCLTVKIFNNTDAEHTVRVRVLDLDKSPVTEIFDKFLKIKAFSTNQFTNIELLEQDVCYSCCNKNDYDSDNFGDLDERSKTFEIVLTDMVAGLYPAAVQTQKDRHIIDSTFIKSADFIPRYVEPNGNNTPL